MTGLSLAQCIQECGLVGQELAKMIRMMLSMQM